MHKVLIILIFVISHLASSAQSQLIPSGPNIDSLKKILPVSVIKQQVDILNKLAEYYAPLNFDSSILYSSQAMRLASIYNYMPAIGLARFHTGNAYYCKMDFKNALLSYLSAQPILEENACYNELGNLNSMLGHINFLIRRGDKAMACYRKALSFFQTVRNEGSQLEIYDAMCMTTNFLGVETSDSSLVYAHNLLNYSRKAHDRYREAYALLQIALIYILEDKSDINRKKALAYSDSALAISIPMHFDELISIVNLDLCAYYDMSSSPGEHTEKQALKRLTGERAYNAALKIRSNYLQAVALNNLARIDLEEGEYTMATIDLDKSEARLNDYFKTEWKHKKVDMLNALDVVFEYFIAQRELNAMYGLWYRIAKAKKEYTKAIEFLILYFQSTDSIIASQQNRQLEIMMAEDEAAKQAQKLSTMLQDNDLNRLKLSRTRFIFLGAGAGILLLSSILLLFFQRKKLKAEQRSVVMEQRLLRAQMNPHFIFNSLASIQNYIINEKPDEASIYLSRFSQLVRNVLDNSVEEYVTLENEIGAISNYMELQKARYADKLNFTIEVDPLIDQEAMCIPPMLAQPFIENAIEHGIKHRETPGNINIYFTLEDHLIHFEVEDDGVGREKAYEIEHRQQVRHRSMSTTITHDRLMTINRKMKKKIRLEIIDLKDESGNACGTRVTFRIPFVEK